MKLGLWIAGTRLEVWRNGLEGSDSFPGGQKGFRYAHSVRTKRPEPSLVAVLYQPEDDGGRSRSKLIKAWTRCLIAPSLSFSPLCVNKCRD